MGLKCLHKIYQTRWICYPQLGNKMHGTLWLFPRLGKNAHTLFVSCWVPLFCFLFCFLLFMGARISASPSWYPCGAFRAPIPLDMLYSPCLILYIWYSFLCFYTFPEQSPSTARPCPLRTALLWRSSRLRPLRTTGPKVTKATPSTGHLITQWTWSWAILFC